MPKYLAAIVGVLLVIFSLGTFRRALRTPSWRSPTGLLPLPRHAQVGAFVPNHTVTRGPDAESVPTTGKELSYGLEGIERRPSSANRSTIRSPPTIR